MLMWKKLKCLEEGEGGRRKVQGYMAHGVYECLGLCLMIIGIESIDYKTVRPLDPVPVLGYTLGYTKDGTGRIGSNQRSLNPPRYFRGRHKCGFSSIILQPRGQGRGKEST